MRKPSPFPPGLSYLASALAMPDLRPIPSNHFGPGRKTLHTLHKDVGRTKTYSPNGSRECARRRRQAERRSITSLAAE